MSSEDDNTCTHHTLNSTAAQPVAVVPAAGRSERMGAYKPLLTFGAQTAMELVVHSLRRGGVSEIMVVVGHNADLLQPLLEQLQVNVVYNNRYLEGMLSSVKAGVRMLTDKHSAFLLLPVDCPLVRPETIKSLVQAMQPQFDVAYPVYHGRRGHPPIISARCRLALLDWTQEGGMRAFLQQHAPNALNVPVEDECILFDMDTPADYRRLLDHYSKRIGSEVAGSAQPQQTNTPTRLVGG